MGCGASTQKTEEKGQKTEEKYHKEGQNENDVDACKDAMRSMNIRDLLDSIQQQLPVQSPKPKPVEAFPSGAKTPDSETKPKVPLSKKLRSASYISKQSPGLTSDMIDQILYHARIWNAEHKITGCLVVSAPHFLQTIEGPPGEITTLLCKLEADNRHSDFEVISDEMICDRRFTGWQMAGVTVRAATRDEILRLAEEMGHIPWYSGDQTTHVVETAATD